MKKSGKSGGSDVSDKSRRIDLSKDKKKDINLDKDDDVNLKEKPELEEKEIGLPNLSLGGSKKVATISEIGDFNFDPIGISVGGKVEVPLRLQASISRKDDGSGEMQTKYAFGGGNDLLSLGGSFALSDGGKLREIAASGDFAIFGVGAGLLMDNTGKVDGWSVSGRIVAEVEIGFSNNGCRSVSISLPLVFGAVSISFDQCPQDPPPKPARPPDPPEPPQQSGGEDRAPSACPIYYERFYDFEVSGIFTGTNGIVIPFSATMSIFSFKGSVPHPSYDIRQVDNGWGTGTITELWITYPTPIIGYGYINRVYNPTLPGNVNGQLQVTFTLGYEPGGQLVGYGYGEISDVTITPQGPSSERVARIIVEITRETPFEEKVPPPECFEDGGGSLNPEPEPENKNPWPFPFPQFPLPKPPRPYIKFMPEDCCVLSIKLLKRILKNQGDPEGFLKNEKPGAFFPLKIKRLQTPIDPNNPERYVDEEFRTFYDLQKFLILNSIALDETFDPRGFQRPEGKVMNPQYERPSEESFFGGEPSSDKRGNKRELELGKDVKLTSLTKEIRYIFKALNRLEYLFPTGELKDARIAKHLIVPGAKKDDKPLQIYNVIHFYELLIQYLDRTLGNPSEEIVIKDIDPTKEGDQKYSFRALNLSNLIQELFKFQMDTSGDTDQIREIVFRDFRTNMANRVNLIQTMLMVDSLIEDSGMLTQEKWEKIQLEGDPYGGCWSDEKKGFDPSPKLESHREEDIEELARATLKAKEIKVKITKRSDKEKTDMRDLFVGISKFIERLIAVPAADLDKVIENAKFKLQTDLALMRSNVQKAATAARNRTRKKKK